MKTENIVLDINDLDDINPTQLGVLEYSTPRYEHLEVVLHRLKTIFPTGCPNFQLHLQTLFAGKENVKVVMIKCDEINTTTLNNLFKKAHDENKLNYLPWEKFIACEASQKLTIVRRNNDWAKQYRGLLMKGFIDNNNNIPMIYNEEMSTPDDPLKKTTVTKYLQHYVKDDKGNDLFEFVYPPVNGVREVIVTYGNYNIANDFMKVFRGELARNMDEAAIQKVFEDPEGALLEITEIEWKPSTVDIPKTECQQNINNNNKRQKTTTIPEKLSVDSNQNYSVSNITTTACSVTTQGNTNWKEEFEQFKLSVTTTIEKTVSEKMDSRIMEKIQPLQNEVRNNTISNNQIKTSIDSIKNDMEETKNTMTEKITATRASIENELSLVRNEMKINENKMNNKLDNNNEKLDHGNSKLDALMRKFGLMETNKTDKADALMIAAPIIGQKRELQNQPKCRNGGERNTNLVVLEPEPGKISTILNHLGWGCKKNSETEISMEIHDSQVLDDVSFANYNGDYEQFKEGNINKLKEN